MLFKSRLLAEQNTYDEIHGGRTATLGRGRNRGSQKLSDQAARCETN